MSDALGIALIAYIAWVLYEDRLKVFETPTLINNLMLSEKYHNKALYAFPKGTTKAIFRNFVRKLLAGS